jgi:MFS family permease
MATVDGAEPSDGDELRAIHLRSRARRNMGPLVWGQAISLLGDYVAYITLPLFIIHLTGSAVDLGLVVAAETLPMLLFGFGAGVYLDRRENLGRTLIFVDATRALAFLMLALAAASGAAESWMVFAVAFVVGTLKVIFDSGLQALMPVVLEEEMLVVANSRLQLARTLAFTFGPVIGGLAIALGNGFATAFLLNSATFIVSAVFIGLLTPIRDRVVEATHDFREELKQGLRFLWKDARLRWATIGGTLTNVVFAPVEVLLVLFVTTEVGVPSFLEGTLDSNAVVGLFIGLHALVGAGGVALAPRVAARFPLGHMYVTGLVFLGGGFVLVAAMGNFWSFIPAGVALTGVTWVNVALATMRQRLTPKELLGRVIAASRTVAWAGLPIGAALGGVLADAVGIEKVYFGGSIAVLLMAGLLLLTPLYRNRVMADPAADSLL